MRNRRHQARHARRKLRRRLRFESLEDRRLLATFVVNSLGDEGDSGAVPATCDTRLNPDINPPIPPSGLCTLRAAIQSANAVSGHDTIAFENAKVPPGSVINSVGQLEITDPVTIDAPPGKIILAASGSQNTTAISIGDTAPNSTIKNLVITGFGAGVFLIADESTLIGNYIGIQLDGNTASGNDVGIWVLGDHNVIGGSGTGERNVISGNNHGILLGAINGHDPQGTEIVGNFVGTSADGMTAVGNTTAGVRVSSTASNTVIGGTAESGNVISGNQFGIIIEGTATGTLVAGNRVGLNGRVGSGVPNDTPVPNEIGIEISGAEGNCVGGPVPAEGAAPNCGTATGSAPIVGNVISANTKFGVHLTAAAAHNVVQGNRIGTDATGQIADPDGIPGSGDELGNGFDGVFLGEGARDNTIGGTIPRKANVVSGNLGDGILINGGDGNPASNNQVIGNLIGVDADGDEPLPNLFRGVHIDRHATDNVIGGGGSQRNVISANGADGIIVFDATATGNVIKQNLIGTDITGRIVDPDGVPDSGDEFGNQGAGIYLLQAPGNFIGEANQPTGFFRNTISGNQTGIRIEGAGATGNVILGNRVGLDVDGTRPLPNRDAGIHILNAPTNQIGTATSLPPTSLNFPGNVISGNDGVGLKVEGAQATTNYVGGNLIGVEADGKGRAPNAGHGVLILGAPATRLGAALPAELPLTGNTISANFGDGVRIEGGAAAGTLVGDNRIGTDFEGQQPDAPFGPTLGNDFHGIRIVDATGTIVGGDALGETALPANVISANGDGVRVVGDTAIGNQIRKNEIFGNRNLGINLVGGSENTSGVTANDVDDGDDGPNRLQNHPVFGGIDEFDRLWGTLDSTRHATFAVDLYASEDPDPAGQGEGRFWLDSTTVETDDEGDAFFEFDLDWSAIGGRQVLTVTATDPDGNTSEFSAPLLLADLEVTLEPLDVLNIDRRGDRFFLPFRGKIANTGTATAENALVRIKGNEQVISEFTTTLAANQSQILDDEWEITELIPTGTFGERAQLELVVEADPDDAIPEMPHSPNAADRMLDFDPRPRIIQIESEFDPKGVYLSDVSLSNRFDLTVDWNGDLDDSEIGADELPSVTAFVNGQAVDRGGVSTAWPS